MNDHIGTDVFTQVEHAAVDTAKDLFALAMAAPSAAAAIQTRAEADRQVADRNLHSLGFPLLDVAFDEIAPIKEAFNPVVLAGRREVIQAINNNLGELVGLAAALPPGKLDVGSKFDLADRLGLAPETVLAALGAPTDARFVAMLRNVQSIEKTADGHVIITQKSDAALPLGIRTSQGRLDDVKLSKSIDFTLEPNSGHISNIHGVAIEGYGGVPAHKLVANVEDVNVTKDARGKTVVQAKASNPERFWEKIVTGDFGNQIPVDIQLQDDGRVVVVAGHGKPATVGTIE